MDESSIFVVIETEGGDISGVFSNEEDVNIAIVERTDVTEGEEGYSEDIMGAPGVLKGTMVAETTDLDFHAMWEEQFLGEDAEETECCD